MLQGIEGAATARRVGTDALTPTFAKLLPMAFPAAELVDGELAMRAARRIKTAEEIDAIRAALRVAEHGLAAAVAELRAGEHRAALTGVFMEAMAAGGVTTPATQDVAWITSGDTLAARRTATASRATATWWPSRPACWPAATSARSAGPGRSATRRGCRGRTVPALG